jgi:hypothetical protein
MDDQLTEATLAVLVTPAEDLPGVWVAHCLQLDLVTQGPDIAAAIEMARAAILDVVNDDLAQGVDPLQGRGIAPREAWAVLDSVVRNARPLPSIDDESRVTAAVGFVKVRVPRAALPQHALVVESSPPPWMLAQLDELRDSQRTS